MHRKRKEFWKKQEKCWKSGVVRRYCRFQQVFAQYSKWPVTSVPAAVGFRMRQILSLSGACRTWAAYETWRIRHPDSWEKNHTSVKYDQTSWHRILWYIWYTLSSYVHTCFILFQWGCKLISTVKINNVSKKSVSSCEDILPVTSNVMFLCFMFRTWWACCRQETMYPNAKNTGRYLRRKRLFSKIPEGKVLIELNWTSSFLYVCVCVWFVWTKYIVYCQIDELVSWLSPHVFFCDSVVGLTMPLTIWQWELSEGL